MSELGNNIMRKTGNKDLKEFVEAMEELVSENKLSSYSTVYTKLEDNVEKEELEKYLNECGDFLSYLRDGDYQKAVVWADFRNGAALARLDPDRYVEALIDQFGTDGLEKNVKANLPSTMEEEMETVIKNYKE